METPRPQYSLSLAGIRATGSGLDTLKVPSAFPCCRTVAWLDGLFDERLFTVAGAAHVLPALLKHRVSRLTAHRKDVPHQSIWIIAKLPQLYPCQSSENDHCTDFARKIMESGVRMQQSKEVPGSCQMIAPGI